MLEVAHCGEIFANLECFRAIQILSQNALDGRLQVTDSAGDRERLKRLPQ